MKSKTIIYFLISTSNIILADEIPNRKAEDNLTPQSSNRGISSFPTCSITAELPKEINTDTPIHLILKTSGNVKTALLDMIEQKPEGGSKKVYPYQLIQVGKEVIDDMKQNPVMVYLGSVSGPSGSSSCNIFIQRQGKTLPQPPTCEIVLNKWEGNRGYFNFKTTSDVSEIIFDQKIIDLKELSFEREVPSKTNLIAQIKGPGGESLCSLLTEPPK